MLLVSFRQSRSEPRLEQIRAHVESKLPCVRIIRPSQMLGHARYACTLGADNAFISLLGFHGFSEAVDHEVDGILRLRTSDATQRVHPLQASGDHGVER